MPIGILKFKLPEESIEFNEAKNAGLYLCALQSILDYFRTKIKYEEHEKKDLEMLMKIREDLFKIIEEYEITI